MKDLPFTALLKPTIVHPLKGDLTVGINLGSSRDCLWRMDSLETGNFKSKCTKVPQCGQFKSLYAVFDFFEIGIEFEFECFGGFMGYAFVVCDCLWC
jgi:hypothetical protein